MEKDLSEKTREIMDLLAAGLSEAEVAARLYLSITVSYHVRQAKDFFQIERLAAVGVAYVEWRHAGRSTGA